LIFVIETAHNTCSSKGGFEKLINDYPMLKKFSVKYDYKENKSYITINKSKSIITLMSEVEEDLIVSNKHGINKIYIYDGRIE